MAKLKLGDSAHAFGSYSHENFKNVYSSNKNNNFAIDVLNRTDVHNLFWYRAGVLTSDLITALYGE